MKKKYSSLVLSLIIVLLSGCRIPEISTENSLSGEIYNSVRINVRTITDKSKEKTKILLGFDRRVDRLIFLGPLNQVLFEIFVRGNYSKVIIPKRKKYWEGEFREFLHDLWHIDLTYNEIKALLLEQRVSAKKLRKNGFRMQIIRSERKKFPIMINLTSKELKLEFKVYEVRERPGKIVSEKKLQGYSRVSLGQMIGNDPK